MVPATPGKSDICLLVYGFTKISGISGLIKTKLEFIRTTLNSCVNFTPFSYKFCKVPIVITSYNSAEL